MDLIFFIFIFFYFNTVEFEIKRALSVILFIGDSKPSENAWPIGHENV